MLLLYIFIMVMIFSSAPMIIKITKKASHGATLKRSIEQAGGKFIPTNAFWYMGSIDGKKCDFHVVFDKRLISVKVIGLLASNTLISFVDKCSYEIKTLNSQSQVDKNSVSYSKKKKKPYDFKFGIPEEYKKLPQARIIMTTPPAPIRVSLTDGAGRTDISVGDKTPEGEYYTADAFAELFK